MKTSNNLETCGLAMTFTSSKKLYGMVTAIQFNNASVDVRIITPNCSLIDKKNLIPSYILLVYSLKS